MSKWVTLPAIACLLACSASASGAGLFDRYFDELGGPEMVIQKDGYGAVQHGGKYGPAQHGGKCNSCGKGHRGLFGGLHCKARRMYKGKGGCSSCQKSGSYQKGGCSSCQKGFGYKKRYYSTQKGFGSYQKGGCHSCQKGGSCQKSGCGKGCGHRSCRLGLFDWLLSHQAHGCNTCGGKGYALGKGTVIYDKGTYGKDYSYGGTYLESPAEVYEDKLTPEADPGIEVEAPPRVELPSPANDQSAQVRNLRAYEAYYRLPE